MYYIDETNAKKHVYPTYGRQFDAYRWYKPIITGVLFAVFYMVLFIAGFMAVSIVTGVMAGDTAGSDTLYNVLNALSGGYDTMDMSDPLQSVLQLGGLAIAIPALWLASVIVRDRPMSSYSSSRGGWSHKVFWKCMPIAFLINGLPIIINDVILEKGYQDFTVKFSVLSFVLLTILGPLQCIAEEYMFRGFVMQTFGSWFRFPLIAVILQALIFAAGHPYNRIGQIAIVASGLGFALSAWFGRGLEVSAALHVVNNMTIFYLQGLGMTTVSSEASVPGMVMDMCISAVYVIVIFWLSRKTKWFDKVTKDDAARANAKLAEKKVRKAARAAGKAGRTVFEVTGAAGSAAADAVSKAAGAAQETSPETAAETAPETEENIIKAVPEASPELSPEDFYGTIEADDVPEFDYSRRTGKHSSEAGKHFKN